MTRLSMDQISRENQNCEVSSVTSLQLSHRALSDVSCLSNFHNLERLDLSYNCLTSLEGLSACANLKWLQVLENKLVTLKGIECLSKLMVLNAGRNKLEKMDEICALPDLRALILNDNNISSICKLDQMKYLNTLVLSRNPIHVIGNSLKKVRSMTKLSLSHCKLQTIGPSLVECVELKEARFSHNEITALPEELAKNTKLLTLDIGNNLIEKLSEIKVLSSLRNLKNLNLLGNPIAEKEKLVKKVKRLVPNIRIFNTKPSIDKGSLHRTKSDDRNRNQRESKQDDAFKRKRPKTSVEETHAADSLFENSSDIGPERKKRSMSSRADVHLSETNNVSAVEGTKKKSKSKSNTEVHEKKTDAQNRIKDFDDEEASFADVIFSGKTMEELESERGREALRDAKLVRQSKKMKSRPRNRDSEFSAFQLSSSGHEIGLGGQSTWDDSSLAM